MRPSLELLLSFHDSHSSLGVSPELDPGEDVGTLPLRVGPIL
ncbi:MAG TPA: hypothetical protein VNN15_01590 [Solirubrobacterales bacterium]|nr:hypothetical protein [Solirubrobacterales bacterium]